MNCWCNFFLFLLFFSVILWKLLLFIYQFKQLCSKSIAELAKKPNFNPPCFNFYNSLLGCVSSTSLPACFFLYILMNGKNCNRASSVVGGLLAKVIKISKTDLSNGYNFVCFRVLIMLSYSQLV